MASYLLYFPGASGQTRMHFDKAGIGDLIGSYKIDSQVVQDDVPGMIDVAHGPDGGSGVLCGVNSILDMPPKAMLPPQFQRWQPVKPDPTLDLPGGRYWIGRDVRHPVTPQALVRRALQYSLPVRLDDGNEWLVPVARQLPKIWGKDDSGHRASRARPEYADFCERSEAIFQSVIATDGQNFVVEDVFGYCSMALAINYKVNEDILDFLELLTDDSMPRITGATLETKFIKDALDQKKSSDSAEVPAT